MNNSEQLAAVFSRAVPYQKCPICEGTGYLPMQLIGTAINTPICDVCQGQKIIPMYIIPERFQVVEQESKKSYELVIGDNITPTEIIEPLKKCLTMGKVYTIIKFDYDHKGIKRKFEILDDKGNKKWYRLDTFHRRWRSV